MKTCTKCGEEKPLEDYHKRAGTKDGRTSQCKECRRLYASDPSRREKAAKRSRDWYSDNKDSVAERQKEYYSKNKEVIKQRASQFYEENKEYINKRNKEYRENNREKVRESQRNSWWKNREERLKKEKEWKKSHRDTILETQRKYRKLNYDYISEWQRKYREENKDSIKKYRDEYYHNNKEKFNEASRLRRALLRKASVEEVLPTLNILRERDGDLCHYCKVSLDFGTYTRKTRPSNLATLEHLQPLSKGGPHTLDNTAIACLQCNNSKLHKTEQEFIEYRKKFT